MAKNGFTAEQMISAIRESNGILAVAARKLGCSRQTVHNYVNKFATVRDAYHDARETNIDYAEGKLMKAIDKGSVPALMFFLRTIGRHRGYVERQEREITGKNGGNVVFEFKQRQPNDES